MQSRYLQAEMTYLQAQMVYLIRPTHRAENLDDLLVLWTFLYLKYSDFCFMPEDSYTSCFTCVTSLEQCGPIIGTVASTPHFFATCTNATENVPDKQVAIESPW